MVVMPQAPEEVEMDMGKRHVVMVKKGEFLPVNEHPATVQEESREQKSLRLQQLLRDMIVEAVQSSNQELCREVKESLLKELDYQFRLQEEKEDIREEERMGRQEEHYRQIDELLRARSGKVHLDKKKLFEGWLKKPKKKAEKEN